MKRGLKITVWILGLLAVLLLAALVAIQSPAVQTAVGRRIISRIEKKTDARISVGNISIRPLEALLLEDVTVLDKQPRIPGLDTVLTVNRLSVKFSLRGLLNRKGAYVSRLRLYGGCFNLVLEPEVNLLRVFHLVSEEEPENSAMQWGNLITAREVDIRDLRFRMENVPAAQRHEEEGRTVEEGVIDWNHLHVLLESLHVNNLRVADNLITGQKAVLTLREQETGLGIEELSAREVRVGEALTRLEDVRIRDGYSDLDLDHLQLEGSLEQFDDFTNQVVLDAQIREGSLVDIGHTVGHFASLSRMTFRGRVKGKAHGTVNNLGLDNLLVEDADNGVRVFVSGRIKDVEEIETSQLDFNLKELSFDMNGLAGFVTAWAPETKLDFRKIAPGERLDFKGTAGGSMKDLRVNGEFTSEMGSILADVYLRNVLETHRDIELGGSVATQNLHLGKVLGSKDLGPVTLRTRLDASLKSKGGMDVQVDTFLVSRLQAKGYDYSGISAQGRYTDGSVDGHIVSADPNLRFRFDGRLDLGEMPDALYRFTLDVENADLDAIHLDSREIAGVRLKVDSDLRRADAAHLDGQITVGGITLESAEGVKHLGDLVFTAHQLDSLHTLTARSRFLNLDFQGSESVLNLAGDLQELFVARELPALLDKPAPLRHPARYDIALQVLDARDLLTFLVPGLYVENKTNAHLQIERDGSMTARINSGRIAMRNRFLKDVHLDANNRESALNATLTGGTLDLGGTQLLDNRLTLKADDNRISLGYRFDNQDEGQTNGQLNLAAGLTRREEGMAITGEIRPSQFTLGGNRWDLDSKEIEFYGGDIRVDTLKASHLQQSLLIDGGLRAHKADTLHIRMDQFDLSLVNTFTGGVPELAGLATGRARVVSPTQPSFGLLAGIRCDSVYVSGRPMGSLLLSSNYDEENKRFTSRLFNRLDGRSSIDASAFLVPSSGEVSLSARLDSLDLGYAEPFLAGLFSEFGGALSGTVAAGGTLKKLSMSSEGLHLADGRLKLDFTGVPYKVDGDLELNDKGLFFTPLRLQDSEGGTGTVEGGLLLSNLSDIGLDIRVRMGKIHALDIAAGQNDTFYGNLYASGRVNVTGALSDILLDIDATTRGGELHIPLGTMSGDRTRELLTFTDPASLEEQDPYEVMMASQRQVRKTSSNLDVKLRARATQDAQIYIDVDNESSLTCSGQGTVDIVSRSRTGLFTINGDYKLNDGNFHFSAMNLVSRNFAIQNGSSVRFNGDVMNTDLNVQGLYVTKASLYNLTADESATSRRTVNCGIAITGKLSNPELDFSIDIPDLNPTVQAQVDAALNTEDKIQKQFIYLLVAGSFLPSEESGISVGGSDVLFSNVSSIMSGQLNNIFQKLDIPLDLGFNYKATQAGSNIFDVAVSTQLFNNRVVVNGTVGNKEQLGGTSTNEVAGDIDIEIKLNRSGSLRLNLFTHSADQLSAFLDNSQRHGGGITYQMEFNTFRQLFRTLFHPRRERDIQVQEEVQRRVKNVVYQIDSTGKANVQR